MRFKKEYLVAPARAASHAIAHVHFGVAANLPGLAGWRGASLDAPVTVFDLNGQPLFYDFPVIGVNGDGVGTVRAAAATPLAEPIMSTYVGPVRWSVSPATERATGVVTREYGGRVLRTFLVCYAYPKLGIAVEWQKGRRSAQRTIFDISDLSVVPEAVEKNMRGPVDKCPAVVTRINAAEALEQASPLLERHREADIAAPVYVLDAEHGRLAWMIEVTRRGELLSRIFATPGYAWEWKPGGPPGRPGVRG